MIGLFAFCALSVVVALARVSSRLGAPSAAARQASSAVEGALRRVRLLLDATEAELRRAVREYRVHFGGTAAAGPSCASRVPYPRLPVRSAAECLLLDRTYRRLDAEEQLRSLERELADAVSALSARTASLAEEGRLASWLFAGEARRPLAAFDLEARTIAAGLGPGGATCGLLRRARRACDAEETWAAAVVPSSVVQAHFELNAASYAALLEPYLGAPEVAPAPAPASVPEPAPAREPEATREGPAAVAAEPPPQPRSAPPEVPAAIVLAGPSPAALPAEPRPVTVTAVKPVKAAPVVEPVAAEPRPSREPVPGPAAAPAVAVTAEEIAGRAQAFPLRSDLIRPEKHLRGYQLFGAKFILEAGRSILGDDMGLGKTVEALAAMAHLAKVERKARFLVVCPAGAVQNWASEVSAFTALRAFVLGGPERDRNFLSWKREGGVLIASYNTLRDYDISEVLPPVSLFVADEAHLIKNPKARRTMVVERIVRKVPRACFMTGTPLENRIAEFRHLAGMLRPDVAQRFPLSRAGALLVTPESFRERAAEIYLRRNQEDVLHELPEKIEVEEWVDLDEAETARYRRALLERNRMAARQAVTLSAGPAPSAKLRRLHELLDVYRQTDEKVLVFSFFHSVLDQVERSVRVVGRIDGSMSSAGRQRLIDDLRRAPGHAVLLAQVEAGGLALNIQAASVVVLTEPQWKPSTERQAIARAYRMGQPRRVIVHRLLARRTIDEQIVALLKAKQGTFDDHVRDSPVKRASLDAVDAGTAAFEEEYVRALTEAVERQGAGSTLAA